VFRTSIPSCSELPLRGSELRCPCSEHLCCYVPNSVAEVINRAFGIIYCGSESFNRAAGAFSPDAGVWNTVFGTRSTGVGLPNSDTGTQSSISKQKFLTFEPEKRWGPHFCGSRAVRPARSLMRFVPALPREIQRSIFSRSTHVD